MRTKNKIVKEKRRFILITKNKKKKIILRENLKIPKKSKMRQDSHIIIDEFHSYNEDIYNKFKEAITKFYN